MRSPDSREHLPRGWASHKPRKAQGEQRWRKEGLPCSFLSFLPSFLLSALIPILFLLLLWCCLSLSMKLRTVFPSYINNSVVKFKGDREKMQLNSLDFMFFLSFICLFYFMVPDKIKNIVLLTASYVFYARGEFM